jgi:hypothetical protein
MSTKYIALESKYAQFNAQTGTYRFQFSNQIVLSKSMRLIYASLPNTVYNVISGVNNMLDFAIDGGTYSVALPPGDYDVDSLSGQLAALMNTQYNNMFTVTYNSTTNLFRIGGRSMPVTLLFASGRNASISLASVLGYGPNDVSGMSITATNMPSLIEPQMMYLSIVNVPGANVTTTNFQSQFTIPLASGGKGSYCIYNEASNYKQSIYFVGSPTLYSYFDLALYCYMKTDGLPTTYNSRLNFVLQFEYE